LCDIDLSNDATASLFLSIVLNDISKTIIIDKAEQIFIIYGQ